MRVAALIIMIGGLAFLVISFLNINLFPADMDRVIALVLFSLGLIFFIIGSWLASKKPSSPPSGETGDEVEITRHNENDE
ncbi:MAG: hypothetical protein JW969_05080 [Spirochaetales bacterium]|nr:hypothetical protein [Spirochaetales bacterium]